MPMRDTKMPLPSMPAAHNDNDKQGAHHIMHRVKGTAHQHGLHAHQDQGQDSGQQNISYLVPGKAGVASAATADVWRG